MSPPDLHLVDLTAGPCTWLLAHFGASGVVNWMGSASRTAAAIRAAQGLRAGERVASVTLADAGAWGWIWPLALNLHTAPILREHLRTWQRCTRCSFSPRPACELCQGSGRLSPGQVWTHLAADPSAPTAALAAARGWHVAAPGPTAGRLGPLGTLAPLLHAEAARYLLLQGRTRGGYPVFEQDGQWVMAAPRGFRGKRLAQRSPAADGSGRGLSIAGLIERLLLAEEAARQVQGGIAVLHGSAVDVEPRLPPGRVVVLIDGPWRYTDPAKRTPATRYGPHLEQTDAIEAARRWSEAGAHVTIRESEPLAAQAGPGWASTDLSPLAGRPEWITTNAPLCARTSVQVPLFAPLPPAL